MNSFIYIYVNKDMQIAVFIVFFDAFGADSIRKRDGINFYGE